MPGCGLARIRAGGGITTNLGQCEGGHEEIGIQQRGLSDFTILFYFQRNALKSTFRGAMPFVFFPGRGHNYLLYLLMDSSSPPPRINNEWSLSLSKFFPVLLPYTRNIMCSFTCIQSD